MKESAEKGGWELDTVDRELPPSDLDMERPVQFDTFDNVQEIVRRHGANESWYAIYRLESASSHATYTSGARYWDATKIDEPGYGLVWDPQERGAPLRVVAVWLLMGLGQFEEIAVLPQRFAEAVQAAAANFEASWAEA